MNEKIITLIMKYLTLKSAYENKKEGYKHDIKNTSLSR